MENTTLTDAMRKKFYEEERAHFALCDKDNCKRLICKEVTFYMNLDVKKHAAMEKIQELIEKEAKRFSDKIYNKTEKLLGDL